MFLKKLLKELDKTARGTLAVSLTALFGAMILAVALGGSNPAVDQNKRPTLRFRCMDFALIPDGSIQARVRLSVENVEKFNGAGFNIKYNPYYIQPAYVDSDDKQVLVTEEDASGRHFERDPATTWVKETGTNSHVSPWKSNADSNYEDNSVKVGALAPDGEVVLDGNGNPRFGELGMYFVLDNSLIGDYPESGKYTGTDGEEYDLIQVMDAFGDRKWESDPMWFGELLYIDASKTVKSDGFDNYRYIENDATARCSGRGKSENGVNLGSITFKVNPDHLTEMVTNYKQFGAFDPSASAGAGGTTPDQDPHHFLLGYWIGEETDDKNAWFLTDYVLPDENYDVYETNKCTPDRRYGDARDPAGTGNEEDAARVAIDFIFPKVLVKAEVAGGKDLTVNAYQAYSTGRVSDIAATVQRYRPEITATLADATSTNYIMNWGDTTPITTSGGGGYKVYRPYNAAVDGSTLPANGYIDRDHRDTPNNTAGWWMPLESSAYDPRGGKYMVTQYFWYEEDGQTKMFPQPMEVCLTVTPVNLVDVNAERLTGLYSKAQAEGFAITDLNAFDLPREAVLSLSPVPGPIVLTMPIDSWSPNSIGALTTANGQAQNWSAVGVYNLKGPDATAIKNYVGTQYPWVTTDGFNKSINATRTVVDQSEYSDINYTAEWVSTTPNGSVTELRLRVKKQKDGADVSFTPGANLPRFRTYLPGGLQIENTTQLPHRPFSSTAQTANGAYSTYVVNSDATLYYVSGAAPRTTHQEDVSRNVNLGGWFYVSVCEELDDGGNEVWSKLIPVYVPPRINYYTGQSGKSYYNAGTGNSDSHYLFDFTGPSAGLYPFYSNSILPKNVVLPIGYTVGTTYDGFTGAEPGAVGQFWVEDWAGAEETDLTHTAPSPSPWCGTPQPTTSPQPEHNIISYGKPAAQPPATAADEPLTPTAFKDAVYGNYGTVENHLNQNHASTALERVRVRVQAPEYSTPPATTPEPSPTPGPVNQPEERIRLIHEDTLYPGDNLDGILRAGGEVTMTTYDVKSVGYIQRETFTLTIVNDGNTDIYGLNVDTVSGADATHPRPAYTSEVDHHFEVLVPPAAYLPAGGSTTFVVTYANNLPVDSTDSDITEYEDIILITSNAHGADDPLKDYIANFRVSSAATYKVTLEIRPEASMDLDGDGVDEFPDMGTAKLVVGPAPSNQPTLPSGTQPGDSVTIQVGADDTPPVPAPSESGTGNTYTAGHQFVWVEPEPYDEYKVKSVFYIDGYDNNNQEIRKNLFLYEWRSAGNTGEADTTMYFFEMPHKDVTVVVEYYEPIRSKLRLSRLMGYVGVNGDGTLNQPAGTMIDEGKRHNVRWYDDTTKIIQTDPNYTETENGATIHVMTPQDSSRPTRPDYVIVLGDYANAAPNNAGASVDDMTLVALRARLRKNYLSPNIDNVEVSFARYDQTAGNWNAGGNTDTDGRTWYLDTNLPSVPTYHNSIVFPAPAVSTNGAVTYEAIRITLKCNLTPDMIAADPSCNPTATSVERDFIVVVVRPGAVENIQNYGNSPKGMIYNNQLISDSAKDTNWANFKANKYRFNTQNRPNRAAGLNNTYWKEAWGGITYAGNDPDPDTENYDEDRYALFLLLGEPFQDPGFKKLVNSAGFNVDPSKVRRSVEVELLDTSAAATTQRMRFNGARTNGALDKVTLDLGDGDKGLVTSTTAGDVIDDWWKLPSTATPPVGGTPTMVDQNVRPGVYTLTYSFPDYNCDYNSDGDLVDSNGNAATPLTVTRPVIILAKVGDENADRTVDATADGGYVQNRVADPLGGADKPAFVSGVSLDYPAWRLFRYRCCDTNNDRNINNIDANLLIRGGTLVPYYKPTDYVSK